MSPEQMTNALLLIVDQAEQDSLRLSKDGYARERIIQHAVQKREEVPLWVRGLHEARLKVCKPKVLRVKGQYDKPMFVFEDGLFIAVQIVLLVGEKKTRVFHMRELAGWAAFNPRIAIPYLGMSFVLSREEEELILKDRSLHASICGLVAPLLAQALAAVEEAERLAPSLAQAFRAPTLKEDERIVAEKLAPFMKGNPLSGLHPASLSLIFRTPWRDLEKIVSFLKSNSATAGGMDEDSVDHVMKMILAHEVMDS